MSPSSRFSRPKRRSRPLLRAVPPFQNALLTAGRSALPPRETTSLPPAQSRTTTQTPPQPFFGRRPRQSPAPSETRPRTTNRSPAPRPPASLPSGSSKVSLLPLALPHRSPALTFAFRQTSAIPKPPVSPPSAPPNSRLGSTLPSALPVPSRPRTSKSTR